MTAPIGALTPTDRHSRTTGRGRFAGFIEDASLLLVVIYAIPLGMIALGLPLLLIVWLVRMVTNAG